MEDVYRYLEKPELMVPIVGRVDHGGLGIFHPSTKSLVSNISA